MNDLQNPLYFAEDIRAIEHYAFSELEVPSYGMMETAGEAVAERCHTLLPDAGRVLIVCGPGNNGGDGYVVARLLKNDGYAVELISLCDPDELKGDAERAKDDWLRVQGDIRAFTGELPDDAELIVDAILGTGLQRPLTAEYRVVVALINDHGAPVVAVDIPSGLSSETGMPAGLAVQADFTETFIGRKFGMYTGQAANYVGDITLHDLGCPDEAFEEALPRAYLLGYDFISDALLPRQPVCHKGDFGHALVIGGGAGMAGAVRMAGEAAVRTGAGLVSVATAPGHAALINTSFPPLMSHGVETRADLNPLLQKASAIAIGPGLGMDDWSFMCWRALIGLLKPIVMDADGLNQLARAPRDSDNWILTPHPGEAGRLLGISTAEVEKDRLAAVEQLQHRFGGVIVLKGRGTLVACDDTVFVCEGGNPGMASGGMGDVLTGVIVSMLAQQLPLLDAALVGVLAHSLAADIAAGDRPRGLAATDVIDCLRDAVNP